MEFDQERDATLSAFASHFCAAWTAETFSATGASAAAEGASFVWKASRHKLYSARVYKRVAVERRLEVPSFVAVMRVAG